MLKWRINRTIDLSVDAPDVERLKALATLSTRIAHELRIDVQEDKKDADLSGYQVKLSVILPDKSSLMDAFDGAVDGNRAVMTLPDICYSQKGEVRGVLYLADDDGGLLPIYAFVLLNFADLTDIFIDTANVVPSISELLDQMQTMREVTAAAQTATQNANTAAANADNKAAAADTAAKAANTAATAADGWAKATATAEMLDTDAEPTVNVATAEDGHKIIAFRLPRGETGATPAITFEVATGEPGTQVQIEQSGTAEEPVVKLTIPRGDTGRIDGLDYYDNLPAELGVTASPGVSSAVARGDHVHPLPTLAQIGAYPAAGIRVLDISLPVASWTGGGPYVLELAEDSVTEMTDCRFEFGETQAHIAAAIDWETTTGTITLTTQTQPTGELAGRVILMEVSV